MFCVIVDADLLYHIHERKKVLLKLCITWEHDLQSCPRDRSLPIWGPTATDFERLKAEEGLAFLDTIESDEEEDEGWMTEIEDEAINDAGLIEHLDRLDLSGHIGQVEEEDDVEQEEDVEQEDDDNDEWEDEEDYI
jgi:hypothetical protein